MQLERVVERLALTVEPFSACEIEPGSRLRLPALNWITLHYVLDGAGILHTDDGRSFHLDRFALAVVPPRVSHAVETEEQDAPARETLRIACGRIHAGDDGARVFGVSDGARVVNCSDSGPMRSAFTRLLAERRDPKIGSRIMTAAIMNECLVLVMRRLSSEQNVALSWPAAAGDSRIAGALVDILSHPEDAHSLERLAARAFMSRSAFAAHFAARFGRPPMTFVKEARLRRGAELLRSTDLPVHAIAGRVGFSSRSHFSRAFRKYFAMSPARFRTSP